ncbi:MAG: DUF4405 domain-containing protein [Chlorobi bacterium]|nr:DUF4405 domain-containing protein [Chlorobiota bacterium]
MELPNKIKSQLTIDTYGAIATASFLICAISGVVLAVPFDVNAAYDSISLMIIANPGAAFFRNVHYWSAQIFLVFVFLHIWEHFKIKSEKKVSSGVWFRLSISILFVMFVMISGFILKGDPDSEQASRILTALLEKIPLAGSLLSKALFGNGESLQLVYVHHVATATIFLVIIILEHARTLWVKASTFFINLFIIAILSFALNAPLHDNLSPVVKGPWYFVGFQEILHWFSNPSFVVWFVILLIGFVWVLRIMKDKAAQITKKSLFYLFWIYMLLTIIGFFFRGENWKWQSPFQDNGIPETSVFTMGTGLFNHLSNEVSENEVPLISGRREACLVCHNEMHGFSPAHDPQVIGCTSCHLGNPFTLDKKKAHKHMLLVPGNLSDAKYTCCTMDCHPGIPDRVNHSLMATNSGIVSVDKFVFGESDNLDSLFHIESIGHTAAEGHLRDLCANCHLGNKKFETGPINQLSRGGGCNACHLNYSSQTLKEHLAYKGAEKPDSLFPIGHPSLDLNISNGHCFGCHSRSGRISTNYEGWHETLFEEKDVAGKPEYKVMEDKRVYRFQEEDVHHKAGLLCVDCHGSYEVMGDGNIYLHEESAVKIQCADCHFDDVPKTIHYSDLDPESKKVFDLKKFTHSDKPILLTSESAFPLVNTFMDESKNAFLIGKGDGAIFPLKPPGESCTRGNAHDNVSCSACHTSWAPQCIGCHNAYDKEVEGYDLLENKFKEGEWVEFVGGFLAEPPALGVRYGRSGKNSKVECAIPGMIMTIDKGSYSSSGEPLVFHRLYAPAAPHTIVGEGRSCKSCHNNPVALGYGRGDLDYIIENGHGSWEFTPQYELNKYDGLPEDAWIQFPFNNDLLSQDSEKQGHSTRMDFRAFDVQEQKRILTVGACLNCHEGNSKVMHKSLKIDFEAYLKTIGKECVLPDWVN